MIKAKLSVHTYVYIYIYIYTCICIQVHAVSTGKPPKDEARRVEKSLKQIKLTTHHLTR